MITITAFRWVPDFARGLVRDLRVRWALEEAGTAPLGELRGPGEQGSGPSCALHPVGEVTAVEGGGVVRL